MALYKVIWENMDGGVYEATLDVVASLNSDASPGLTHGYLSFYMSCDVAYCGVRLRRNFCFAGLLPCFAEISSKFLTVFCHSYSCWCVVLLVGGL